MSQGIAGRPLAETSVPALTEADRAGRLTRADLRSLSWDEDSVTRWRSLGLFGALVLAEGLWFGWVEPSGASFLGWVVALLFVTVLLAAARGDEYTWGCLGAAGVAVVVAVLTPWAPGPSPRFLDGVAPANGPAAVELGLIAVGVALLLAGALRSVVLGRRAEA